MDSGVRGFTVKKPDLLSIYTRLKEKSSISFDRNITILLYLQSASMKFSELQRRLERDGWYIKRTGGHYIYVHPEKKGEIVVGKHGSKEVPTGTAMKILKQAGLK